MKKALVYILTVLCTLSFVQCTCAEGVQVGTLLTAPAPYDLTVVLPEDMTSIGSTDSFLYGYASADMLVGLTPVDYTDFDQLYAERIGEGFAEETELTINGMEARLYTPPADYGIAAIYEVRAGEENSILELAFYPRDLSATAENQAARFAVGLLPWLRISTRIGLSPFPTQIRAWLYCCPKVW